MRLDMRRFPQAVSQAPALSPTTAVWSRRVRTASAFLCAVIAIGSGCTSSGNQPLVQITPLTEAVTWTDGHPSTQRTRNGVTAAVGYADQSAHAVSLNVSLKNASADAVTMGPQDVRFKYCWSPSVPGNAIECSPSQPVTHPEKAIFQGQHALENDDATSPFSIRTASAIRTLGVSNDVPKPDAFSIFAVEPGDNALSDMVQIENQEEIIGAMRAQQLQRDINTVKSNALRATTIPKQGGFSGTVTIPKNPKASILLVSIDVGSGPMEFTFLQGKWTPPKPISDDPLGHGNGADDDEDLHL